MTESTRYLDRESGSLREEPVYGGATLELAYQTRLGRTVIKLLPHRACSVLYGWLQRRSSSRARIPAFIDSLGIDAAEAELPVGSYRSLDDFFCRRLKPETRVVDPTPSRLVSPADGRTLVFPSVDGRELAIKGQKVDLAELLRDPAEARSYARGAALVVRLAPCDYHRFHFPDSGVASAARLVGGRLHSVHPIALRAGAPSFRNKRHITRLDSDNFGRVMLVEIGAFAVGTIVQAYRPGPVTRGQEKGYFRFGGSTVVVLIAGDRITIDQDLIDASAEGIETYVKMGTSIGSALPIGEPGERE